MAVQTIILRPNGQNGGGNLNNLTRMPADTADENLHSLISEEVPDDDATYISANMPLPQIKLIFPLEQIAGIVPIDIRLVVREKSTEVLWGARLGITYVDNEGNNATSYTKLLNENLDVYETIRGTIADFELIKDQFSSVTFFLHFDYISGASKTGSITLTQLYLEVDYDDEAGGGEPEETAVLYLKKSGAWEGISGKVYNKVNGAWVVGTLDDLQADGLVVVQEVV